MKNELYNEVLNHIARGYNKEYKGSIFEEGLSNAELKKRVEKERKKKESVHFEYSPDVTFIDRKLMEKVRAETGRDLRSTYMLVMRYKLGELTEEDLYKPYNKRGRKPK